VRQDIDFPVFSRALCNRSLLVRVSSFFFRLDDIQVIGGGGTTTPAVVRLWEMPMPLSFPGLQLQVGIRAVQDIQHQLPVADPQGDIDKRIVEGMIHRVF